MNVVVVTSIVPFVRTPIDALAEAVVSELETAGHQAEPLRVPFAAQPDANVPAQMLMFASLQVPDADRLIALTFPACLVPHPAKTVWLIDDVATEGDDPSIRLLIDRAGERSLRAARCLFAASTEVKTRLESRYDGLDAELLRVPQTGLALRERAGQGYGVDWPTTIDALVS